MKKNTINSTTIIGIRRDKEVVIAGDGQASMGPTIIKARVKNIRPNKKDFFILCFPKFKVFK